MTRIEPTPPYGCAAASTSSRTSPTAPRSTPEPDRFDRAVPGPLRQFGRKRDLRKLCGSLRKRSAHEPPPRRDRPAAEHPLCIDDLQRDRRPAIHRDRRKFMEFRQCNRICNPVRPERRSVHLRKINEISAIPRIDKPDSFRSGAALHLRHHRCRNRRNSRRQHIRVKPHGLHPKQGLKMLSIPQLRAAVSISDVHYDNQDSPHKKGRNSGRSPNVASSSLIR